MTVWTAIDISAILAALNLAALIWVARAGRRNLNTLNWRLRKLRKEVQTTAGRLKWARDEVKQLSARSARLTKAVKNFNDAARKRHKVLRDGQLELALLQGLSGLHLPYPYFLTGWTIHGFLAFRLVELLEERRPKVILELGSGSSTVLIAAMIDRLGLPQTTHVSVDHMPEYLRRTEQALLRQQIKSQPRLVLCPLEAATSNDIPWYSGLPPHLAGLQIDLVLVDGPPGGDHPLSRLPALEALWPFLAPGATVLLDDVMRPAEAEIVELWSKARPELQVRIHDHGKGYAEFTLPSAET